MVPSDAEFSGTTGRNTPKTTVALLQTMLLMIYQGNLPNKRSDPTMASEPDAIRELLSRSACGGTGSLSLVGGSAAMELWAHTPGKVDPEKWQSLEEHLVGVARLAEEFEVRG